MTLLNFTLITFFVSIAAGVLGSLLGLGGGIVIVPFLTLCFGIDIRYAVGASIVSVIATSTGAAVAYIRERMTNMRVAMFLEIATASGALTGAYLTGVIPTRGLYIIFGLVLGYSAILMYLKRHEKSSTNVPPDALSDRLRLHDTFFDEATGNEHKYRVTGSRTGFFLMYIAGILSALLGIGSGSLKVPAMDLIMRLPIKVSTATSNFMIGVTAAASAGVYFSRGQIDPWIAGPVVTGVLLGATLGSKLLGRIQGVWIRSLFVIVMLWVSAQMLFKGIRG